MKRSFHKSLCSLILIASLLSSLPLPGFAAQPPEEKDQARTLYISSESRFLQFAESCRLDSYSKNLTVYLTKDLDLTGLSFEGIPLFLGTFEGNHHQIAGLSLSGDGSHLGLFRFLQEGSTVRNLTVSGSVSPGGSRLKIGGIAGTNQGTIAGCRFEGSVAGGDQAGGIAGENALTGTIENCRVSGSLSGDHFVGGIAGENSGVIRSCISSAEINTSVRKSGINVKSISLETIAGTEDTNTVTDTGGIAGTNLGVIRDCLNRGQVGYQHVGYNTGGIAGSQLGYITGCQNYGAVFGRKEVGGIAGQFEPVSQISYEVDTLKILEQQLAGASSLLNQAAYNAQGNMGTISQGITDMKDASKKAIEAIEKLKPGEPVDPDTLIAAHNTVKTSIQTMQQSMETMNQAAGSTLGQLSQDLKAVSSQMGAMSKTIREANEHLGIRLADISDADTDSDLSGKISDCINWGPVNGDLNAGGIAGSIAYENDLDPEEDLKETGERSLNMEGSVRAVILNCRNQGSITVKRLHAGGIVGWMSLGLTKNCINTGALQGEKAQYAGGIAGCSRGYIRNCSVKCEITAGSLVGGIAGSGTVVTDCLSMVLIEGASEKQGAVLGILEPCQDDKVETPAAGNLYMCPEKDPGAIDGISYQGIASPLPPYQFQYLDNLPEAFSKSTLIFRDENGSQKVRLVLPIGSVFHPEDVPEVPEKPGFTGQWQDMELYVSHRVYFDKVFAPQYTPYHMTIASREKRENGRPILLAEGSFRDMENFISEQIPSPDLNGKKVLEAWSLPRFTKEGPTTLHFYPPEGRDTEHLQVFLKKADGTWKQTETSVNARHLIFTAEPQNDGFCVLEIPDYRKTAMILGIGAALAAGILTESIRRKMKKKTAGAR